MIREEGGSLSDMQIGEITKIADKKGEEEANDEMLSCQFILGADNGRFKEAKKALANAFTLGSDDYPKIMTAALALLKNYKPMDKNNNINNNSNHGKVNQVAFVAAGASSSTRQDSSKTEYLASMHHFDN